MLATAYSWSEVRGPVRARTSRPLVASGRCWTGSINHTKEVGGDPGPRAAGGGPEPPAVPPGSRGPGADRSNDGGLQALRSVRHAAAAARR